MSAGKPRPSLDDTATAPYWEAARRHELLLPCCDSCGLIFAYPRRLCPGCWSSELTWRPMSGEGRVWTFTEVHVAFYDDTWARDVPYVIAVVELAEGPRLMANLIETNTAGLRIGDRVQVVFTEHSDGDLTLPMFRVVPASSS